MNTRQATEQRIAGLVLQAMVESGRTIHLSLWSDGSNVEQVSVEKALEHLASVDDEVVRFRLDGKPAGAVQFVFGNDGWDCLADYSSSLEALLAPALAEADRAERQAVRS
jgi:hypothetical protein